MFHPSVLWSPKNTFAVVAAASRTFPVMDGIYTTSYLPDKLGIGASHFYVEVLRVSKMAVELSQGKTLFVIFDELFRGTNVKDAHEATVAVINAFAEKNQHVYHFFVYRGGREPITGEI